MKFLASHLKLHPLKTILVIALIIRVLSAIFSQGYGMHDDHFLIIEASSSWAHGSDFNNWLPQNQVHPQATGHNLFYIGIHYILFVVFQFLGIQDPKIQMLIIRLLHAVYSLLIVYYGFKITRRLSDEATAIKVGLMLALIWYLPMMSVRNLVEIVCIPFLMAGSWLLIRDDWNQVKYRTILWAGLIMSIAVSIRYQALIFVGGTGLALLLNKRIKEALLFGLGCILSITIIQTGIDLYLWGAPFQELLGYIKYNIRFQHAYGVNNYLMYFEVILGFLIPPLSIFLFFGFLKVWKKHLILFLPTILFLAFHTYFPNKQERFILTIIPFIIILGWIGWNEFVKTSKYWEKHHLALNRIYNAFWIINLLVLPFISLSASKMARVNAMYSLYPERNQIKSIVVDDSEKSPAVMLPVFYTGKAMLTYTVEKSDNPGPDFISKQNPYLKLITSPVFFKDNPEAIQPQYILFANGSKLKERIAQYKIYFPEMKYIKTIQPSNVDLIMHKLNPKNKIEVFQIYRVGKP